MWPVFQSFDYLSLFIKYAITSYAAALLICSIVLHITWVSGSILQIEPDKNLNPIAFHPQQSLYLVIQSKCRRRNLNFTQQQQQSNYSCDHYKICQQQ
jgi:hypothetical protein